MPKGFGTRGRVARRRRRLGPQLRDCLKDLAEIIIAHHVGSTTEQLERSLIIWWMRWFVTDRQEVEYGEQPADQAGQDSLFPEEKETD